MMSQSKLVYNPSSLYITPTLVIGLGGTGIGVIRQLKRRIRSSIDPIPGIIEFLAVDTDMPQNMPGEERIFDREIAYIGDFNAGRVIDHLEQHPHIKDWWPNGQVVRGMIFRGARQRRLVGRLSLYARWGEFARRLDAKLDKIRQIAEKEEVERRGIQVERTGQVRVYIVSSLCGGTGSGVLLDVAFRVRSALGDDAQIYGMFVMPSAFLPEIASYIQRLRIQGNAYAALKEIDYFLSGQNEFRASFPDYTYQTPDGTKQISYMRRPFDTIFLIDRDNGKEPLGGLEEVRHMVSQAIFLDLLTPLGKEMASKRENMSDLASEQRVTQQGNQRDSRTLGVASVSTASLVLPALDVVDQIALRIMQNQVLREKDESFINQRFKEINEIINPPEETDSQNDIKERLQKALISAYLEGGLYNTKHVISRLRDDIQEKLSEGSGTLERTIRRLFNSEETARRTILNNFNETLSSIEKDIDTLIGKLQPWREDRLSSFSRTQPNTSPNSSQRHDAYLFELVTKVGYEQEVQPLAQTSDLTPPIGRYLAQLLTKEEETKLIEQAQQALFNLKSEEKVFLDPQCLEDPVAAYLGVITDFVRPIVSQRATILNYLRWFYKNVTYYSNASTQSQGSPIDPLRQLKLRCQKPFLNIDNAKLGTEHQQDIEFQRIIGYSPLLSSAEKHDPNHVLADFDNYTHVDTGVLDRLDILIVSFGYRICDLSNLDDLKKAYDYFMKTQQETLHIHKDWTNLPDIV